MMYIDLPGITEELDAFWAQVITAPAVTVWIGRRCAHEHAGWREVANRRTAQLALVDTIDFEREYDCDAPAFTVLPRRDLLACRMADRSVAIDDLRRAELRRAWERLRADGTPLRVVEHDALVSAPITYFDDVLLRMADDWAQVVTVVGLAMGHAVDDKTLPQLWNDTFAVARVLDLVDAGRMELDDADEEDFRWQRVRRVRS
jgi:hypothetical protein